MGREDIEQVSVLASVVLRLQTALSLTDRQAYEVARADDVPVLPVGGSYFLTVAPGSGTFEPQEQAAGNITEYSDVIVTGYSRIRTDSSGHDTAMLSDDSRGLLAIKKLILGALCGQDLTDADGNTFLRQWIYAKSADSPNLVNLPGTDAAFGSIRIVFGVDYDWNIL